MMKRCKVSKARGYTARVTGDPLSGAGTSLDLSLVCFTELGSLKAVKAASAIIDYFSKQMFIGIDDSVVSVNSTLPSRISRLLTTSWKLNDGTITPIHISEISQKHQVERIGHSYLCSKYLNFSEMLNP